MSVWRRASLSFLVACAAFLPGITKAFAQGPAEAPARDPARESLVRTAPPGFEDIAAAEVLTVPIVVEGLQVGEASARIDLATLTFDNPAAVAALTPNLTARDEVTAALSGPLPLRADLACGDTPRAACGRLAPDVAGIIYDRVAGEVQLFVNPTLRRFDAQLGRISPAGVAAGLIGGANVFFSGDADSGDVRYTLNLNATAGLGRRHLQTRGSLSANQTELDAFALRSVTDGREWRAGLIEGGISQFRTSERLIGLRWGTTLDDLADRSAYDAPIVVALTEPARIDVFSGDRLIGTARYPAGSVRIDTSGFPAGAYTIRLRIDEGGQVREEERFFSRETAFPPIGAPQTFVALGTRRSAPGFSAAGGDIGGVELQVGHRRSLGTGFGAGGALFVRAESVAAEAAVTRAFPQGQASAAAFWSSADEAAVSATVRAETGSWRWSLDTRYVRVGALNARERDSGRYLVASDQFWQTGFSLGRRIGSSNFSMFGSWRDSARGGQSWTFQPSLDLPFELAGGRATLRLSGGFSERSEQVRVEVSFNRAPWRGGSLSTRTGYQRQSGRDSGQVGELSLQQTLRGRGAQGAVGARWRTDQGREEVSLSGRVQGPYGALNGEFTQDLAGERGFYFGTADTGFALSRAGLVVGASGRNQAAIVFVNRSEARDGVASALVGGSRVGRLGPGQRRMHGAEPFRSVSAAMIPAEGAAVASDSRPQSARLYPGTVAIVEAEFVHVAAAFGRLVDESGAPLAGVWLSSSVAQSRTDANGWFQLDVAGRERIEARREAGAACGFDVDAVATQGAAVLDLGDVTCR